MTRIAPSFPADDPRHGSINGYNNLRCRCDECREAKRTYPPQKAAGERWRRRQGMRPRTYGVTHGLRSTYVHGCRCAPCTDAERRYKNDLRARKRAA